MEHLARQKICRVTNDVSILKMWNVPSEHNKIKLEISKIKGNAEEPQIFKNKISFYIIQEWKNKSQSKLWYIWSKWKYIIAMALLVVLWKSEFLSYSHLWSGNQCPLNVGWHDQLNQHNSHIWNTKKKRNTNRSQCEQKILL